MLYLTKCAQTVRRSASPAIAWVARYPIRAQTPASQVFDYYAPDQGSVEPPRRVIVELGTPD